MCVVTGDETMVLYYDPFSKREPMEWRRPGEVPPLKAKVTQSSKKFYNPFGIINILKKNLLLIRRCLSDFPPGCDWEAVVKKAECKKEVDKLFVEEEIGWCIPEAETPIEFKDQIEDLRPINGVPDYAREINTVIIQKRTKNSMQSGTANTHVYILSFHGGPLWENPLMGWTSGSNPLTAQDIPFPCLESATHYAQINGWNYIVPYEAKKMKQPDNNYGLKFSWNRRCRSSTK